jgi:arylsulfatase A
MVTYLDKLVGKIVNKLDEQGLLENSLIFFVGDNGTPREITSKLGDISIEGGKGNTTNAGTHVPFIVNWKGNTQSGMVCDDLIDFTDFLPTILQAANIKNPSDFIKDGVSFFPQLLGQKGNPRDWIFCHYDPKWGQWELKRYVQDKRWKLYQDGIFFDLQNDPLEENPMKPEQLSEEVKNIKRKFEQVLSKMK